MVSENMELRRRLNGVVDTSAKVEARPNGRWRGGTEGELARGGRFWGIAGTAMAEMESTGWIERTDGEAKRRPREGGAMLYYQY